MRPVSAPRVRNKQFIGLNYQATAVLSGYCGASFHDAEADGMQKENNGPTFEGLNAPTLFREFAAECIQLAQTTEKPEKRALYLKMASVWHQMAQRWE